MPPVQLRMLGLQVTNLADHKVGLGGFVLSSVAVDAFALATGGAQHFVNALGVVFDQVVGHF